MSTVKFHVPHSKFKEVYAEIKKSGVRYYPIRREFGGYRFEIDDTSLTSFLILKFDLHSPTI